MPSAQSLLARRAPAPSWRDAGEREHLAQIYESDDFLVESVANYIQSGMAAGAAAIVIATGGHLDQLRHRWAGEKLDVEAAIRRGQLILLEAKQVLDALMRDGRPDPARFGETVESIVAAATTRYPRVVAFGEMVNLLWSDGQLDAAIALEDCWNDLASRHNLTLLCAYHLHGSSTSHHAAPFEAVCSRHSRVIPAESSVRFYSEDPLRVIALLQQKAFALDQQMHAQQHIEADLAHLAAIVASSDDAIVSKSLDGTIRSWNVGAERIFGYTAAEAIGQPITLIIPEELRDEERLILGKVRSGEQIEHFETERVARDGQRVFVSLSVSPVRDGKGEIIGASKIARDVSERRRADEAVAQAKRQLAQEAMGLVALNEWSTRLWRCESLQQGLEQILEGVIHMLGADKGNILLREGEGLRIAAHRGFDQSCIDVCDAVALGDASGCGRAMRSRVVEIIHVEADPLYAPDLPAARDAGYRTVVSAPLLAGDGKAVGVLNVYFATVHQPIEAELRRLALYARQATDFIQRCEIEETLRRKERMLLETDRRKNEFLATLAHEMRNPLAPISSGLQIMKMAQGDPQIMEQARSMMERQVGHMVRLVEDLMDVSRIGQGKVDLRKEVLDLNDVLRASVESCRPRIDAAGHRLLMQIPANPIWVEADKIRLTQVFVNLLNNAAKYTDHGGTLTVHSEQADADAVVRVSDTGLGIPVHMLDKVFDLFTQVDESQEKSQGGIGIGLSLVKGLVQAHGGTVTARSGGPGKGSEFSVRLPVTRATDLLAKTL